MSIQKWVIKKPKAKSDGLIRTRTIRLMPNKRQEAMLFLLCDFAAILWNKLNYARRQDYFKGQFTWARHKDCLYNRFSPQLGSSYSQQIMRKNDFAWQSFFELLSLAKKGKLPPHMAGRKLSPPGFWKNKDGSRKKILLVRNDQYRFEGRKLFIPASELLVCSSLIAPRKKLAIKYNGFLLEAGKQKELEIHFDEERKRWYAHQPREIAQEGKEEERQGKACYIDLGARRLFAAIDDDDQLYLAKSGAILSDWRYWAKELSKEKKRLNKEQKQKKASSKRTKKMYDKQKKRHKHFINCLIKSFIEALSLRGISKLFIGDLRGIRANMTGSKKTNQLSQNFWDFGYIIQRFQLTAENFGMTVELVNEADTSKTCALCGKKHRNGRIHRGLYRCKKYHKVFQADFNGAINIRKVALSLPLTTEDRGSWLMGQPVFISLDN